MGRDEPVFSISYEFKTTVAQIKNLTNLLNRDSGVRELRLHSDVSPDSFALLCRHLSGENIEVTAASAPDLKLLGKELSCPDILNLVKEFELKFKKVDLSDLIEELREQVFVYKTDLRMAQHDLEMGKRKYCDLLDSEFSWKPSYEEVECERLWHDDFSQMNTNDNEALMEKLSHLSSLKSEFDLMNSKRENCMKFQSELRESVVANSVGFLIV